MCTSESADAALSVILHILCKIPIYCTQLAGKNYFCESGLNNGTPVNPALCRHCRWGKTVCTSADAALSVILHILCKNPIYCTQLVGENYFCESGVNNGTPVNPALCRHCRWGKTVCTSADAALSVILHILCKIPIYCTQLEGKTISVSQE